MPEPAHRLLPKSVNTFTFSEGIRLPDGDERPGPVRILDAKGRHVKTLTAAQFRELHPIRSSARKIVYRSAPINASCHVCGTLLNDAGICKRCVPTPSRDQTTGRYAKIGT